MTKLTVELAGCPHGYTVTKPGPSGVIGSGDQWIVGLQRDEHRAAALEGLVEAMVAHELKGPLDTDCGTKVPINWDQGVFREAGLRFTLTTRPWFCGFLGRKKRDSWLVLFVFPDSRLRA